LTKVVGVKVEKLLKMSGIDEILSYKKNPDEDFYAMLNCDENSSVSADQSSNSEKVEAVN
jgi:hypothetical protein